MSDLQIISACENLWGLAIKDKKPVSSCETDRRPEGTYTNGFRNNIEAWMHEQGGFVIRVKKVDWQTFDPTADKNGKRRVLEILRGEEVVFKATQEGASTTKKFGAGERYLGSDNTPESGWKVDVGAIPPELQQVPA